MSSSALGKVGKAFADRATGEVPGRFRAATAAVVAGAATAALTYRLLRSGS